MNEHVESFSRRLKARYSIDAESMSISDWLEKNTTLRKRAFSLTGYEFQRQIADDMHVNLNVIKPSQVGLTEVQIRKALAWVRRNDGVSIIYTMPNDEMKNRVSQTRIKPIVTTDKVFDTEFDEDAVRSKGLLQFGQSFLYLTGSKEGDATSIPADMIMNDEVDLTNEKMLALFRSRLQGSKYKIQQKFSTPTYPKFGISKDFADSDQHEYFIKCPCCNHQQVPLFSRPFCHIPGLPDKHESLIDGIELDALETIDLHNAYVMCEKCHEPLDLSDASLRQWVARYEKRGQVSRGYRIRPFSSGNLDIPYIVRELIEAKKRSAMKGFHNTVLGESYIDDSIALSEDMVRQAFIAPTGFKYAGQPCFIGVDMGMNCHITVGTFNRVDGWLVFHWEICPATKIVERTKELLNMYKIVSGCVDRFPYTPTAIDMRSISSGRIIPVEYRGPTELNVRENELSPEESYAQVNKTGILDTEAKLIRDKQMRSINYGDKEQIILRQLTDNVRHEEEGVKPSWVKQTGDDHFFHSLAFMIAAKKSADFIAANNDVDVRSMVATSVIDIGKTTNENLYASKGNISLNGALGPRYYSA